MDLVGTLVQFYVEALIPELTTVGTANDQAAHGSLSAIS